MFFGALYSSIFTVIWIKGVRRYIFQKEKLWFIALSILSGILLVTGVLLALIHEPPAIIKENWRYVFCVMLFIEMIVTYYELTIAPKQLLKELEKQHGEEMDLNINWMLSVGAVVSVVMLAPGLYFNYRLAFL